MGDRQHAGKKSTDLRCELMHTWRKKTAKGLVNTKQTDEKKTTSHHGICHLKPESSVYTERPYKQEAAVVRGIETRCCI